MKKAQAYSDKKNWSDTYLTDPKIIKLLGPFDLDPACPPVMPWKTAKRMLTNGDRPMRRNMAKHYPMTHDGLAFPWRGRVWMNPPYKGVLPWARKFAEHGSGICLLNGRSTETRATQLIMECSRAIFFPKGRLTFYTVKGKPLTGKWFPSLLIGMSAQDAAALHELSIHVPGMVFYRNGRF